MLSISSYKDDTTLATAPVYAFNLSFDKEGRLTSTNTSKNT